ncbi:hypothetical protein CHUAL_008125 [Chamberlinius hualienensis]
MKELLHVHLGYSSYGYCTYNNFSSSSSSSPPATSPAIVCCCCCCYIPSKFDHNKWGSRCLSHCCCCDRHRYNHLTYKNLRIKSGIIVNTVNQLLVNVGEKNSHSRRPADTDQQPPTVNQSDGISLRLHGRVTANRFKPNRSYLSNRKDCSGFCLACWPATSTTTTVQLFCAVIACIVLINISLLVEIIIAIHNKNIIANCTSQIISKKTEKKLLSPVIVIFSFLPSLSSALGICPNWELSRCS